VFVEANTDQRQTFINVKKHDGSSSADTIPMMNFDLSLRRQYKRPLWLRRAKSEMYIRIPEKQAPKSDTVHIKEGDSWIEQALQKTKLHISLPRKKYYGDLEETAPMIRGDEWIPDVPVNSCPISSSNDLSIPPEDLSSRVYTSFSKKRMIDLKISIPTEKHQDAVTDTRTAPVDVGDSWITLQMMGESDATLAPVHVPSQKKTKWYKRWFSRPKKGTNQELDKPINV
jgi:hypothetical protein